jgi:hypothetical protein
MQIWDKEIASHTKLIAMMLGVRNASVAHFLVQCTSGGVLLLHHQEELWQAPKAHSVLSLPQKPLRHALSAVVVMDEEAARQYGSLPDVIPADEAIKSYGQDLNPTLSHVTALLSHAHIGVQHHTA